MIGIAQTGKTGRRTTLRVEALEDRAVPAITAIGATVGGAPRVQVFQGGRQIADFFAYDSSFRGGVQVAVGDVNGDGYDDVVTGAAAGGGPNVKVFPGTGTRTPNVFGGQVTSVTQNQTGVSSTPIASFFAYAADFTGGVQVAVGNVDVTNDLIRPQNANAGLPFQTYGVREEIITAPLESGGPNVKVFGNSAPVPVVPAPLIGGAVPSNAVQLVDSITFGTTFDGNNPRSSFFAFNDPNYRGGLNLAVGNLNAFPTTVFAGANAAGQRVFQLPELPGVDGFDDIVVGAGVTGSPRVAVYKNLSTQDATTGAVTFNPFRQDQALADFFAYDSSFRGGVYVDIGDQNGDGVPDIVTGVGPGGGPNVRVFASRTTPLNITNPPFSSTTLPAFLLTPYGAGVNLSAANTFDTLTGPINQVLLFNGIESGTPYASFFAADSTYTNGVKVRSAGAGFIGASYGAGFPGITTGFSSNPATFPTTAPTTFQFRPSTYTRLTTFGQTFDPQYTGGLNVASTEGI